MVRIKLLFWSNTFVKFTRAFLQIPIGRICLDFFISIDRVTYMIPDILLQYSGFSRLNMTVMHNVLFSIWFVFQLKCFRRIIHSPLISTCHSRNVNYLFYTSIDTVTVIFHPRFLPLTWCHLLLRIKHSLG